MEMFYSLLILLAGWVCFVFAITNIIYGALRHANEHECCGLLPHKKENRGWKIFKMLLNALALTIWYCITFCIFDNLVAQAVIRSLHSP